MQTQNTRRQFLEYFKKYQHAIIPSAPVFPHDDPSLLFTNAGMNQFKDVFLGKSKRDYKRAVTSQKCIRAGGKHNDLENVGHTSRHLTFFEMLGNFSFGDYFKSEAIRFSWEVSTQVFGFDPDRIWPTVFREDDEAFEMWKQYVPADRITRFDEKDNFWAMGDTGPCGPCSELLYDKGEKYGTAKTPVEDVSGERFLEFWNLVFMQYNRTADGVMDPLPRPSIDTGAGLERVISLQMNVDSLFETDVLRSLIRQVEQISHVKYDITDHARAPAFRVIADHLRALAFAIADGVQPSNIDRGYVLRKILRRAVRYGRTLGMEEPFLAKVLPTLVQTMGSDYPELTKAQGRIEDVLTNEEEAFLRTLRRGGNLLSSIMENSQKHNKLISGDDAFKLKDTYGLPIEEILLMAKDAELSVDLERYQQLEQQARERSRNTQKTSQQLATSNLFADYVHKNKECVFLGYDQTTAQGHITALVMNDEFVTQMNAGDEGIVILDQTPFYAEMGGQVGDTGTIQSAQAAFTVTDCTSPFKGVIGHVGKLQNGQLNVGDLVTATVDVTRRHKIQRNHTATHLLHWALHKILGEHVKQAGSVVDPARLRFDFSHHKSLSKEEIEQIENIVNQKIRENTTVSLYEIPYEEAQKKQDIKQFFGEKYDSRVRVVDIDFSKELCGGTHVSALGSIGLFRIAKESSIAAGMRRIEAVTGEDAEALSRQSEELVHQTATLLKTQPQKLYERVEKLLEENKKLSQELKNAKKGQTATLVTQLVSNGEPLKQGTLVIAQVDLPPEELRSCAEEVVAKLKSGIVVLGMAETEKCQLFVRVSDDLGAKGIQAVEIIKAIAPIIEGSGGGKQNSAQAGGKAPHKIEEALATAKEFIKEKYGLF